MSRTNREADARLCGILRSKPTVVRSIARVCARLVLLVVLPVLAIAWPGSYAELARASAHLALDLIPAASAQDAPVRFDRGLLWRIERAGGAYSHVFGTVHLADPRVTRLPEEVGRALDDADSFAMEVSLDPASVAALAARMLYSEGGDLRQDVGPELYGKVVPLLARVGIPPELAARFKPWAAMLLIAMPAQDPQQVLDYRLMRIAAGQSKPVHFLESIDQQVAAFEGMPAAAQIGLLKRAVETDAVRNADIARLLDAYLDRDLARMWRISQEVPAGREDLGAINRMVAERVLFDRNESMVARALPRLEEGRAFIAVGALHLYGERGMLALLEKAGYRVVRVY